jgi:enoyl-CoA hydratase
MEYKHIIYQPGKIARIILNRPQFLNAQSYLMLEELNTAFLSAESDPDCGVIILSGSGRSFCVGHDIGTEEDERYKAQAGYTTNADMDISKWFEQMRKLYVEYTLNWRNLSKPTIAMVHGYCIFAGWMLASAMDIIFSAVDAQFLPGFTEYFSVPWDISPRKAREILFEHRFMTANEACSYGFVNRIFPSGDLEKETLAYAERVADNYLNNSSWVRFCKYSINHMEDTGSMSSEISTTFNNFCLMTVTYAGATASPDEGGFARTKVAKRNLDLSLPWLKEAGLA